MKLWKPFVLCMVGNLALWGCGKSCKSMIQCDYYVAKKGDASKQKICADYAENSDIDGAHATAAWFYLLGGKPEKARLSALQALKQGQSYAAGYLVEALVILGRTEEAKKYKKIFERSVKKRDYFKKEIEMLERLYPRADFSALK